MIKNSSSEFNTNLKSELLIRDSIYNVICIKKKGREDTKLYVEYDLHYIKMYPQKKKSRETYQNVKNNYLWKGLWRKSNVGY